MFLSVSHEGCATGTDGCGISGAALVLAVDVAVGVADVDFAELCR